MAILLNACGLHQNAIRLYDPYDYSYFAQQKFDTNYTKGDNKAGRLTIKSQSGQNKSLHFYEYSSDSVWLYVGAGFSGKQLKITTGCNNVKYNNKVEYRFEPESVGLFGVSRKCQNISLLVDSMKYDIRLNTNYTFIYVSCAGKESDNGPKILYTNERLLFM